MTKIHERVPALPTNVIHTDEFGADQKVALALAGTVRVPLPVPASGKVYLIVHPESNPVLPSGIPRYSLKHVQTVSHKQVVTRYVALNELRAVDLPSDEDEPDGSGSWSIATVNEESVAQAIQSAQSALEDAVDENPGTYEELLFSDAALYVREAAPVFVRIVYEFGVTAAEAASHVECIASHTMRCC